MSKITSEVFNVKSENHEVVIKAYKAFLAEKRSAFANTKTRGEVRGGGKKPWRQKGTGRARAGSSRSPIWVGGGVTFGPSGNQNYTIGMSKTEKRIALMRALSLQNEAGIIELVSGISVKEGKTKEALEILKTHKIERGVVIVLDSISDLLKRSFSNLQKTKIIEAKLLTVFDVMNADRILITKEAVSDLEKRLVVVKKKTAKKDSTKVVKQKVVVEQNNG
jgi:large subunit ribosomal protein L4